jgi:hypothetical protein
MFISLSYPNVKLKFSPAHRQEGGLVLLVGSNPQPEYPNVRWHRFDIRQENWPEITVMDSDGGKHHLNTFKKSLGSLTRFVSQ